jgi:lipopolysaccharide/colanic/teichoic acid biosynthesis glycosyltransferase
LASSENRTLSAALPAPARRSRLAKAAFDRICAAVGLVLFSPLLAAAAAAIVSEDGLPVLFRQRRVGRNGALFEILKFRSMRRGTPGARITSACDPRLTRVGKFLRRYKIDELPQLWNVLKGEMSLVGPRPEVPAFVDPADPVWRAVLEVMPGITSLASIAYRHEEQILAPCDEPERYYRQVVLPAKLALNFEYIQRRSFWLDLKLILLTLRCSPFPSRKGSRFAQPLPAAKSLPRP